MTSEVPLPGTLIPCLPEGLDAIVRRSLERDLARRYATAREMAQEIEACVRLASLSEVGAWVEALAPAALAQRAAAIAEIESTPTGVADLAQQPSMATRAAPRQLTPRDAVTLVDSPPISGTRFTPGAANDLPAPASNVSHHRARRLAVAVLGATLAVGAGFAIAVQRSPSPSAASTPGTATSSISARAVASFSPTIPSSTTPASPPLITPDPSLGLTVTASPSVVLPKRPRAPLDCDPPYSLDAQGHKRWKPQCF
jgi:serine/threonine-protein kinase